MVDKILFMENMVDPFTKALIGRVFIGHRDNIGFKLASRML